MIPSVTISTGIAAESPSEVAATSTTTQSQSKSRNRAQIHPPTRYAVAHSPAFATVAELQLASLARSGNGSSALVHESPDYVTRSTPRVAPVTIQSGIGPHGFSPIFS